VYLCDCEESMAMCICVIVKVRPRYLVCREAVGECDVAEFCDGISGQVGQCHVLTVEDF